MKTVTFKVHTDLLRELDIPEELEEEGFSVLEKEDSTVFKKVEDENKATFSLYFAVQDYHKIVCEFAGKTNWEDQMVEDCEKVAGWSDKASILV